MSERRYYIDPGPSNMLMVRSGNKTKQLCKIDDNPAWKIGIAFAILCDVLKDENRARMLATRFVWRVMEDWQRDQSRLVSEAVVRATVDDIDRAYAEAAPMRRMVDRERLVPDIDVLPPGVSGNTPPLRPNLPKRK